MKVLLIDTATDALVASVGEIDESGVGHVLASGDKFCRRESNVELLSTLLDALHDASLSMSDIDAVICGRGPGSFTGVRIGIATAKGLSAGLNCKLFSTITIDSIACGAHIKGVRGLLGVVGDAMRGEVYPALYLLDDAGVHRQFGAFDVFKVDDAVNRWASHTNSQEIQLVGDGLIKYADKYREANLTNILDESLWHVHSDGMLKAFATFSASQSGDAALVLPLYTRLSDAEENEAKRLGGGGDLPRFMDGCADDFAGRHMQLRPMNINDSAQVSALEYKVFEASSHSPWSKISFEEELSQKGHVWWVAHDEGKIIGFAGGRLADETCEILDVAVDKCYRGKRIAYKLMSRVTYDAMQLGATNSTLEVGSTNNSAISLYKMLGYSEIATRKKYYADGSDAIVMRADLPLKLEADDKSPEPTAIRREWPKDESISHVGKIGGTELILAIETSCDETAMSIIDSNGVSIANVVSTQIDFHARFGGVVPEIAGRKHTEAIIGVYEEVMEAAGAHFGLDTLYASDLSCVSVTKGPGLVGALVVGVAFAKGLAAGADLKLIGVNHLEGHLYANLLQDPNIQPPFVASLVSGGHTLLVHVKDWGQYKIMGSTIDDAVGEAFDKVAKALGLGYPGGPIISRLAAGGDAKAIEFPRAMLHSGDYSFSLSGLKTAVITYIERENKAGRPIEAHDLAASFEAAVIDVQVAKALKAVKEVGAKYFCLGGGVAANPELRAAYIDAFGKIGVKVCVPPFSACTDNAQMIALVALRDYKAGHFDNLSMDADPNLML